LYNATNFIVPVSGFAPLPCWLWSNSIISATSMACPSYLCLANSYTMNRTASEALFTEAKRYFPGGVNSPVRAFRSVGGTPLFMDRGKGAWIWDADGNRFIDFCCSWGPLILGHANPDVEEAVIDAVRKGTSFGTPTEAENRLAALILKHNKVVERLRFVSSGTEAVMSAIRLARGATGRSKVVKFDGCYHGHVDGLLVKAGSGLATLGTSSSAGVPEAYVKETIVLPLNDIGAFDAAIERYGQETACVIIEPIPANNGLLLQDKAFLNHIRQKTSDHGILLLFDEVISGFRVGFEGAAGLYNVQPDIVTYGKIIGGGMPVGAYGASAALMAHISPDGSVYQAGTLSGNPVAMAAGYATLRACLRPGFYEELENRTAKLVAEINDHARSKSYPLQVAHIGSIFWLAFSDKPAIRAAHDIDPDTMRNFSRFHAAALEQGLYFGPSGYEVGFVSAAHTDELIDMAVTGISRALDVVFG
jgi:glutamate-1-semialdehyde 2,1-aminomutase